jgi:HD superfamily phosphohydrolase
LSRLGLIDESRFSEPVRDPVWHHIWLTPELRDITRSEPFLRLYRIKQLGPTELVYPGAAHSRASHSLGVYHVALRMLRALIARGADSWVTAEGCASFLAAALLHDLGHFPFTHSLKELPLEDHEALTACAMLTEPLKSFIAASGANPEMAASIVCKDSRHTAAQPPAPAQNPAATQLPAPGTALAERATLQAPSTDEADFFRKILSGVLDPDKLDYLNRDAYYCGVPYGIQDTDFILSSVIPDRNRGIALERKAIMSIESVLFSKYLMYRSVYWHPRVRIATAMMKKAIYAALEGRLIDPETLYSQDDAGIYALLDSLDFPERSLGADIRSRRFYPIVAEHPFEADREAFGKLEDLSARTAAERRVAELLSSRLSWPVSAAEVLIDVPERITFESDLFIKDENAPFSESSTVFSREVVTRFSASLRMVRLAVHPSVAARLDAVPGLKEELAKSPLVG